MDESRYEAGKLFTSNGLGIFCVGLVDIVMKYTGGVGETIYDAPAFPLPEPTYPEPAGPVNFVYDDSESDYEPVSYGSSIDLGVGPDDYEYYWDNIEERYRFEDMEDIN